MLVPVSLTATTELHKQRLRWPERYGAGTAVIVEWRERLVCSKFRFVEQPKASRSAAGGCRNEAMQLARSTAAGLGGAITGGRWGLPRWDEDYCTCLWILRSCRA